MVCLEVWRERRVEESKERRVMGRRVEENGYPLSRLDVFKIKQGGKK